MKITTPATVEANKIRIIEMLIEMFNIKGYLLESIFDGEDTIKVSNAAEAIEIIHSVEYAVMNLTKKEKNFVICLIPFNGNDGFAIIHDHSGNALFYALMDEIQIVIDAWEME